MPLGTFSSATPDVLICEGTSAQRWNYPAAKVEIGHLYLPTTVGSWVEVTPLTSAGTFPASLIPPSTLIGPHIHISLASTISTAAITGTTYARTATTQSTLFSTASSAAGFASQAAASSFLSNMNNVVADLAALTTRVNSLVADVGRLVTFANQFNTLLDDLT